MRRLPIYILINCSASMKGEPIEAVKNGLDMLLSSLRRDPYALESVHLSVITFDKDARVLVTLTELPEFNTPELNITTVSGKELGSALQLLCKQYDKEIQKTTEEHKGDWIPIVVIMTSGEPSDTQQVAKVIPLLKERSFAKIIACVSGIKNHSSIINEITKNVFSLDTMNSNSFAKFWKWVSTVASAQSRSLDAIDEFIPPPPPEVNLFYNETDNNIPPIQVSAPPSQAVHSTQQSVTLPLPPPTSPPQNPNNPSPNAGDRMVITIKGIDYAFRWCPAGTFKYILPSSEKKYSYQLPSKTGYNTKHQITFSSGFWIGETPVTQNQWESVMGKNPSYFKGTDFPVERVSFNDCKAYIERLNQDNIAPVDFKFYLPTETQWEYACRAGTLTDFSFGDSLGDDDANFENMIGKTTKVGSFPANAWGLYDMHGNVWEWCSDRHFYYPSNVVTCIGGAVGGDCYQWYVIRGGSWKTNSRLCHSVHRCYVNPMVRYLNKDIGLRLCLVIGDKIDDTVERYRKLALDGNSEAQVMLGDCYFYGRGVVENKSEAVQWFQRAELNDDRAGTFRLGRCYQHGYGVSKNSNKAFELFKKLNIVDIVAGCSGFIICLIGLFVLFLSTMSDSSVYTSVGLSLNIVGLFLILKQSTVHASKRRMLAAASTKGYLRMFGIDE
ncbi:MAG: SUMF1/EgtB/PvdO family nonheme iron enzyme [Planctomycetaceae bacterium]|nr:SUMF1/EgtB/PvdO family nonheme iron enzyme [Planctomycetaceae bacterium]